MKRREILLVDAVALHRAAWTSFLRDWAEDSHAAVVSVCIVLWNAARSLDPVISFSIEDIVSADLVK